MAGENGVMKRIGLLANCILCCLLGLEYKIYWMGQKQGSGQKH